MACDGEILVSLIEKRPYIYDFNAFFIYRANL